MNDKFMISKISKLFAAVCFVTSVSSKSHIPRNNLRLIQGEDVGAGEYDYVIVLASIRGKEVYRKCTASIISSKWVLTAAHCVESYKNPTDLEQMYIWYLNFTISPLETKFYSKILEIFIHPHYVYSYNNDKIDLNDIALARVRSVLMQTYGRLLSTDYQSLIGSEVCYVGGGQAKKGPFTSQDEFRPLQAGKGVLISCDASYLEKISYPLVCVAPRCAKMKQTAWYGDAGGPLIHDDKIIGILVTINPTVVTAYVPISPYIDWIYTIIETQKNKLYINNNTRS